ncbi:MAG: hypothetical protein P8X57_05700, partial [Cyclobacteriaceae bacterium]
ELIELKKIQTMKNLVVLLLSLCMASISAAQTSEADRLLQNGEHKKAAAAYLDYLAVHPDDSLAAFKLGRTYAGMRMWSESDKYYAKALQGQFPKGSINYQRARNELAQSHPDKAMDLRRDGAESGMRNFIALQNDPLFDPLRDREGWAQIMERVEKNTYPCISNQAYRKFDFWLGSWNVFRNGVKVGENEITRANGGCAIHEKYTTYPRDYTGQSINYYDPIEQRWHQHWVGSSGDVTNYYETSAHDGMMQFTGKTMGQSGNIILNKMTFTQNEDGSVRQLIEASADDGSSWSVSFDGLYVSKSD